MSLCARSSVFDSVCVRASVCVCRPPKLFAYSFCVEIVKVHATNSIIIFFFITLDI